MMRSRIYLASALSNAALCNDLAAELGCAGFVVTSNWHFIVASDGTTSDPEAAASRIDILAANLADLASADVIVGICHIGVGKATYAEIGYALAIGREVVWVQGFCNEGRSLFDSHRLVRRILIHPMTALGPVVAKAVAEVGL